MSRKAIILGALVLVLGMVAIASIVEKSKHKSTCCSPDIEKKSECNTGDFKVEVVPDYKKKPARDYSNLWFNLRGLQTRSVTQQKMKSATEISHVYSNYPKNWIDKYVSVHVAYMTTNDTVSSLGKNNVFTSDQKRLLSSAPLNAILNLRVKYLMKNSITEKYDTQEMNLNLTVVPEKQAVFQRGMAGLEDYMKQYSSIIKTLENFEDPTQTRVWFTVNKEGKVEDVRLTGTSGDKQLDETALGLVRDMPIWTPATNNGKVVAQEYEFTIGFPGC